MKKTYAWSIGIAAAILGWLGSGLYFTEGKTIEPSIADQRLRDAEVAADRVPTNVKIKSSVAREITRYSTTSGMTQNKRTVITKTETTGKIVSRPVERGDFVKAGALLCEISVEDRGAKLAEAEQRLAQAKIDFLGAQKLRKQGFNSESAIAAAKTALAQAQASVKRNQVQLEKTKVFAPFDGIVEEVHLEEGDFVNPGQPCGTVIDLDPMLLTARVSQTEVQELKTGMRVKGTINDTQVIFGAITFIGSQSDAETRTYPIEVQIANEDMKYRSGFSVEIDIPMGETFSHQISPALLTLDDRGDLGVRVVDEEARVQFYNVSIVAEDLDGVWVSGLPYKTDIITVGQEIVVAGERVTASYSSNQEITSNISNTIGASSSARLSP